MPRPIGRTDQTRGRPRGLYFNVASSVWSMMIVPSAPPCRLHFLCWVVLAVCLVPVLAGCSLWGSDEAAEPEAMAEATPEEEAKPALVCPQPGFPKDVDRISIFAPGKDRFLENLITTARFIRVEGECGLEDDGRLLVEFELSVVAVKGPAIDPETDEVTYPYFVALISPTGAILSRQEGVVEVAFSDTRFNAPNDNTLDHEIYISDATNAGDYQILAGFILDREQLAYNRHDVLKDRPTINLLRR